MVSPDDLRAYVRVMREEGVAVFQDGGLKILLNPPQPAQAPGPLPGPGKLSKGMYERLRYAATEGLPDDDDDVSPGSPQ